MTSLLEMLRQEKLEEELEKKHLKESVNTMVVVEIIWNH